jgi:restriction system protein
MTAPARTRRRPAARRPAVRRRQLRRDVAFWAGLAAVALLLWAAYWLAHHLLDTALIGTGLAVVTALLVRGRVVRGRRRVNRTHTLDEILALNSTSFEFFTAGLLRRDGCTHVERVGGAGDLAADNLAVLPDGRKLLVQDKFYSLSNPVGSPDLQKVGGTFQIVHRADVAMAVTTSHFTPAAVNYARQAGIILVDREKLAAWAAGGRPPWQG